MANAVCRFGERRVLDDALASIAQGFGSERAEPHACTCLLDAFRVVEALEHAAWHDDLGRAVGEGVHRRVLAAVVDEATRTPQELGEIEARGEMHGAFEAFGLAAGHIHPAGEAGKRAGDDAFDRALGNRPGAEVGDDAIALLARDISKQIENELEYPGQIKVNVVRESRVIDYAK